MILQNILLYIRVLFTPSCWVQNYPYSPEYDRQLRKLMAAEKFAKIDSCYAVIGSFKLWVENHPYASFVCRSLKVRPSRATILLAYDKLIKDTFESMEDKKT